MELQIKSRLEIEPDPIKQTRLIYILYFVGAVIWPCLLAGVIIAYVKISRDVNSLVLTHSKKQVRIFWIHFVWSLSAIIVIPSSFLFFYAIGFSLGMPTVNSSGSWILSMIGFAPAVIIPLLFVSGLIAYVVISSLNGLRKLDATERA